VEIVRRDVGLDRWIEVTNWARSSVSAPISAVRAFVFLFGVEIPVSCAVRAFLEQNARVAQVHLGNTTRPRHSASASKVEIDAANFSHFGSRAHGVLPNTTPSTVILVCARAEHRGSVDPSVCGRVLNSLCDRSRSMFHSKK